MITRSPIWKMAIPLLITTLLLFSPFVNDSTMYNGADHAKELWFLLIIPFFLIYQVIVRRHHLLITPGDLFLLLFVCYAIARGIPTTIDVASNNFLYILLVSCFFYFFCRQLALEYDHYLPVVILLLIVSGIALSCVGILQHLHWIRIDNNAQFDVAGFFSNPAPLGCYLSVCTLHAIAVIKNDKAIERLVPASLKKMLLPAAYCCLILSAIVIPLSGSRAALLSLAVGSVLIFKPWLLLKALPLQRKMVLLSITGVGLLALLVSLYLLKPASANGRVFIWKISGSMIAKHPVIGVGPDLYKGNYGIEQAAYFEGSTANSYETVADNSLYAFNEFIEITCELGIIGLLLFALFLIYSIWPFSLPFLVKKKASLSPNLLLTGFKASLLCFAVFGIFSYPFQFISLSLLFFVSAGMASIEQPRLFSASISLPLPGRLIVGTILLLLSVMLWFSLLRHYHAYKNWQIAISKSVARDAAAGKLFEEANAVLHNDGAFLADYGKHLMNVDSMQQSISVLTRSAMLRNDYFVFINLADNYSKLNRNDQALKYYQLSCNMVPNRFFPLYKLMQFYIKTGDNKAARTIADRILEKPAKVNSAAVEEMKLAARGVIQE